MPRSTLPPARSLEPFPKRWQDACRAAIVLYCDLPENRTGAKAMKMTRLRNEIMADFDQWNGEKRIVDRSLGREDLEHWIKGKNYLSDFKFQYVDRWIRKFRNDTRFKGIFYDLISFKEAHQRSLLVELYGRDYEHIRGDSKEALKQFEDVLLFSEVLKAPNASRIAPYSRFTSLSDYRQILIYFRSVGLRSASVTIAYIDTPLSELRSNPARDKWVTCFAHLTIIGQDQIMYQCHGVLHAFRHAFPGQDNAGSSVSQVTIYPGEGKIYTDWYPQICLQNLTGYLELEKPETYSSKSQSGGGCFFITAAPKFDSIKLYMSSLTDQYLIW